MLQYCDEVREIMYSYDEDLMQRLREGQKVLVPTTGFSMRPFIEGGRDKVIIHWQEEIHVGDIVMVPFNGKMILHRVYRIEGTKLILMGDGNLRGNEVVEKVEVWGIVLEIIKPNGHCRKPHKARLWRHLLPVRRYLLKIDRKLNKLRNSSRVSRPEVSRQ